MRSRLLKFLLCISAFIISFVVNSATSQSLLPVVTDTIAVGGNGGWDYLSVDTAAHRLYVSHSTCVEVIDLDTRTVIGSIKNTSGVHGIALVPELHKGFTSNGANSTVTVFDLRSLAILQVVSITGRKPDAIIYDNHSRRVFTFNGGSANATVIDPATCAIVGTVALGGAPESAVADGEGHIFVNIEDQNSIVCFNATSLKVEAAWPLSPCETPTGLSMDRRNRRLFVGGRNQILAVVDADSGRVIATFPIGKGVDGTAFDPATHLIFASNKDGTLDIISQNSPSDYAAFGRVNTLPGAKTLAIDTSTHRIYLPAGDNFAKNVGNGLVVLVLSERP